MASGIPAGVIDVGSNTVRLLVARFDDAGPVTLCSGRVRLGLGAELEQLGRVSAGKLVEATEELASVREYRDLQSAEETDADDDWDLGVEHVLALPYDTAGGLGLGAYEGVEPSLNVSYDRVPKGSAELRHASAIVTADGHYLGGIKGFQLADGGQIQEVVLEESHFWTRNEITIPVDAVQTLETDTVVVRLSADEIAELPTTRVRRWF